MDARGRVCLIGAGSSGIVAAKIFADRGISFDGFELGSDIGGIWRYGNDSGRSPAYASLETNTSTARTAYACFPMRAGPPRFVLNGELLEYFDAFVDQFSVRRRFRFNTEVTRVAALEAGYEVTVRGVETGVEATAWYESVVVAAGHHWDAKIPSFSSDFAGVTLHSREYRTPTEPTALADQRVLVVGFGNSACDIACEAAGVARQTVISTRSGAHVLPKMLFGRPIDLWITPLSSRLPVRAQGRALDFLVRLDRGDQRRFGIARPPRRFGEEHPTLSQDLPALVEAGRVAMKPDVVAVEGRSVRFSDGSKEAFDVLICATGYHLSFPFLSTGLLDRIDPEGAESREGQRILDNRIRLFHHVVAPACPGLYFLGLVQPLGAIPPLAEAQAEWVAELLTGEAVLPPSPEMTVAMRSNEKGLERRFGRSGRHTLEVDVFPYRRLLARERKRGRRRATRA